MMRLMVNNYIPGSHQDDNNNSNHQESNHSIRPITHNMAYQPANMGSPAVLPIRAGQALGFMTLGASLFDVLTKLKSDTRTFPKLDMTFSAQKPLQTPVIVSLPKNGFRLRFDGPDQRLRLIEITDFTHNTFTYKSNEVVPVLSLHTGQSYLTYKKVYTLFGPTYPGEFIPLKDGSGMGLYVLSWPGLSVTFPLPVTASMANGNKDYAAMLTASAGPATAMAIYEGKNWPEVRKELFTHIPSNPRCSTLVGRGSEGAADEVEHVNMNGAGKIELVRRSGARTSIVLSQTTPQDLITELGPPDAIMPRSRLNDDVPHKTVANRRASIVRGSYGSTPSSVSSTNTDTFETDFEDDEEANGVEASQAHEQQYYCYFEHGFDMLLGPPTDTSPLPKGVDGQADSVPRSTLTPPAGHLTVTQVVFHGNIPGSYPFNRHRRSRWSLNYIASASINSESPFASFHQQLVKSFSHIWPAKDMLEGMVIVRSWGGDTDSSTGSAILINGEMDVDEDMEIISGEGWEREKKDESNDEQWLENTKLYKFPGLMFEVMHNGAVSALTVY